MALINTPGTPDGLVISSVRSSFQSRKSDSMKGWVRQILGKLVGLLVFRLVDLSVRYAIFFLITYQWIQRNEQ